MAIATAKSSSEVLMESAQTFGWRSLAVFVLLVESSALGIGYKDFPSELRDALDDRVDVLEDRGGACIAGRVVIEDEESIHGGQDVKVNLIANAEYPVRVYKGGWFILNRVASARSGNRNSRVVLRAFDYDPIDDAVQLEVDAITYLEYAMQRVSRRDQCSVSGDVADADENVIEGATVSLYFPHASLGLENSPRRLLRTDSDGAVVFRSLSPGEYVVLAHKNGFAHDRERVKLQPGDDAEPYLVLTPHLQVTIEYVYQPDGTTDFRSRDVEEGRFVWRHDPRSGVDFSTGKIVGGQTRDLELRQKHGKPMFRVFYAGRGNGFHDAGEVRFESVTEAPDSGYRTQALPCIEGHVYVVRTYEEGHYAKFVVKEIR